MTPTQVCFWPCFPPKSAKRLAQRLELEPRLGAG